MSSNDRNVYLVGGGLHPFGRYPDKSIEEIGRVAIRQALDDSGVPFEDIEVAYCGHVYQGMGAGLRVVSQFGETGIPIVNVELACASSSTALRQAYWAIANGLFDVALVAGFEKMTRGLLNIVPVGSYDYKMGLSVLPSAYALNAKAYMAKYEASADAFAYVSVKSHKLGALNPNAQYQKPVTIEEVKASRMISDPLTLLQCSPTSDGASAVILCSEKAARRYSTPDKWVRVAGWAAGTQKYVANTAASAVDELAEGTVSRLAHEAYTRAGVGPSDVGVTQVHDAFTPGEVLTIEELEYCKPGEGADLVLRGETDINGRFPVNTDGGLISRGHPVGATGAAQAIELMRQLRGEAGARQVPNRPKIGLQQNAGVGGVVVMVYEK
jgi:benzoylsuccinyl-CoA thiolase BbsB subunit